MYRCFGVSNVRLWHEADVQQNALECPLGEAGADMIERRFNVRL
jgi:hypothetical protein